MSRKLPSFDARQMALGSGWIDIMSSVGFASENDQKSKITRSTKQGRWTATTNAIFDLAKKFTILLSYKPPYIIFFESAQRIKKMEEQQQQ